MSFAIIPRNAAPRRVRYASLLDQFLNDVRRVPTLAPETPAFVPHIDVSETEEAYKVQAELPGVAADDFELIVEGDVLTLKGEKRRSGSETSESARRREAVYGRFERRLRFRSVIPEEGVAAEYKNGVLTVTVPKPGEAKPEVRTIPVTAA